MAHATQFAAFRELDVGVAFDNALQHFDPALARDAVMAFENINPSSMQPLWVREDGKLVLVQRKHVCRWFRFRSRGLWFESQGSVGGRLLSSNESVHTNCQAENNRADYLLAKAKQKRKSRYLISATLIFWVIKFRLLKLACHRGHALRACMQSPACRRDAFSQQLHAYAHAQQGCKRQDVPAGKSSQTCKHKPPGLRATNSLFWAANSLSAVRQNTAFRSSSSRPKKEAFRRRLLRPKIEALKPSHSSCHLSRSVMLCVGGPNPAEMLEVFRRAGLE